MANKSYAVLKMVLAVISFLIGAILVLSIIAVLSTGSAFTSNNPATLFGAALGCVILLGISAFFLWGGYRLLKSARKAGPILEKRKMSFELRIVLAILCFLAAGALLVMDIFSIATTPGKGYMLDLDGDVNYNRGTIIGFWSAAFLMLVITFFLVRTGYRLLKPVKEKIEFLGEEF